MAVVFAEQELHNACQVLFGADMQVSRGFLDYLQLSGLKSAYRKKALETHPDMFSRESPKNGKNGDIFMAVQQAYDSLVSFIDARTKGYTLQVKSSKVHPPKPQKRNSSPEQSRKKHGAAPLSPSSRKTRQSTTVKRTGLLHKGPIPKRKLLFGHYMYYSGLVNWQTITKALVWQRTRRPRIGEIGCNNGWLTKRDILVILKNRNLNDSFGKSAVRHGFLSKKQLYLLLTQQKRLQKKFGEYFVANNLLTKSQMNLLVQQFRNHNYSVGCNNFKHRDM